MARRPDRTDEPRPRSDVYVGMLALTALAMTLGITLLALESSADYNWDSQPKGGPAISLPPTGPAAPKATTGVARPSPLAAVPAAVEPVRAAGPVAPPVLTPLTTAVTPPQATVPVSIPVVGPVTR